MNIVVGTVVSMEFPLFKGGYSNPKFDRTVFIKKAVCVRETYGDQAKHWFTFDILESDDEKFTVGKSKRMQGRNAYPACTILEQPEDVDMKTLSKNIRAKIANEIKHYH